MILITYKEDGETITASHNQENDKEIKPDEVPENPMTSDVAYMSTSTPKPGTKHQQLKVKFQDKEEASNKGLHVETPANNYFTIIPGFVAKIEA